MQVPRFRSWLPWDSRASGWARPCSSILWSIKSRPIPLWELAMDHLLKDIPNVILWTSNYLNCVPLPSSISFLVLFIPLLFLTFRTILNIFSGPRCALFSYESTSTYCNTRNTTIRNVKFIRCRLLTTQHNASRIISLTTFRSVVWNGSRLESWEQ